MNIVKHGKIKKGTKLAKIFRCNNCECIFVANKDEYYITVEWYEYEYSNTVRWHGDIYYMCNCPECNFKAYEKRLSGKNH
ncbi:MAG: hypothetical protein FWC41_00155 [Firmicutes bacterium]|nr:hypothetical protein [Bacillota bacterium]